VDVKIKKSFTLIELMVVIAIISVLASMLAFKFFNSIEKGRISELMRDYREIKTAALSYYADTSNWPANNNASVSLVQNDMVSGWHGPYLDSWPHHNPWNGNYNWFNDTAGVVAGAGISERYLGVNNIPSGSASSIDKNLDDGNITTGFIRYSAANSILNASISDDSQ